MDSAGHGGEQSVEGALAVGTHPEMLPRGGGGRQLNNWPTLDPSGALFVFF